MSKKTVPIMNATQEQKQKQKQKVVVKLGQPDAEWIFPSWITIPTLDDYLDDKRLALILSMQMQEYSNAATWVAGFYRFKKDATLEEKWKQYGPRLARAQGCLYAINHQIESVVRMRWTEEETNVVRAYFEHIRDMQLYHESHIEGTSMWQCWDNNKQPWAESEKFYNPFKELIKKKLRSDNV